MSRTRSSSTVRRYFPASISLHILQLTSSPSFFVPAVHYDATSTPGRQLPLIATARGSILSLITPQPRYMIRGTNASFTKTGVDVQEPQLIKDGAAAISKPGYAVEPKEQHGVLYRLEDPTKPETIVSEKGNYGAWFENVAEVR